MRSREGYTYTTAEGLTTGLETDAFVPVKQNYITGKLYDAVVIGAGFAGLIAGRDLCLTVRTTACTCYANVTETLKVCHSLPFLGPFRSAS